VLRRALRQHAQETRIGARLATLAGPTGGAVDEAAAAAPASQRARLAAVLLGSGKEREEVEALLEAAGWRGPDALLVFALLRLGAPLACAGVAYLLGPEGPARPFLALSAAAAAFLAPKQILRFRAAARTRRIRSELPFTLDLLVMMLESGVGIDQAFRTFAQSEGRAAPLTQAATQLLVRDLDLGAPYEFALERWAERLGTPGAQEVAKVIARAMRHGASLGPVLKAFAREFGELRVAQAREAVGRTSAKMTLAMLVLIMPALFIVLAGPAVATLGKSIRALAGAS